jgi:AGCS family alanine or glycine:cation symporter
MTACFSFGASAAGAFQAFMTALAGSIGTGNIAGVATAIVKGGPGALFWIWVYGFLAMAIKFAEASLGLHYRVAHGEQVLSGPMYYLRDGLKAPWLAWLFALIAGVACLFTTPFTQPNSVALVINSEFGVPKLAVGIVLAILTWLVIVRGVKSIGAPRRSCRRSRWDFISWAEQSSSARTWPAFPRSSPWWSARRFPRKRRRAPYSDWR